MSEHDPRKTFGRVALICAAWALLLAVVKFGALWPYQLTRWAMCGAAVWAAFNVRGWRLAVAGVIAVVYNPIDPLAFGSMWRWVNVLTAAGWLAVYPWSERAQRRIRKTTDWLYITSSDGDYAGQYSALLIVIVFLFVVAVLIGASCSKKQEDSRPSRVITPFYHESGGLPKIPDEYLRERLNEERKRDGMY